MKSRQGDDCTLWYVHGVEKKPFYSVCKEKEEKKICLDFFKRKLGSSRICFFFFFFFFVF